MNRLEKLKLVHEIIENAKQKTSTINKADIDHIEDYYRWPDGTIFTKKMLIDFNMFKDFESEFRLNRMGGYQLLRILLYRILGIENENDKNANDKFIENYKKEYEKKDSY